MEPPRQWRWRDRKVVIAGLATVTGLGLIFILAFWLTAERRLERRVTDVNNEIREELPAGTNVDAVFTFLDSRRMEHSEYVPNSRTVYASIRNAVVQWPIYYGIFIQFHFDEAGGLNSYEVDVAGDAP
jgi:hypothetical protein